MTSSSFCFYFDRPLFSAAVLLRIVFLEDSERMLPSKRRRVAPPPPPFLPNNCFVWGRQPPLPVGFLTAGFVVKSAG